MKIKYLLKGLNRKGGRNTNGRITVRHKGGGNKNLYRIIDFNYQHDIGKIIKIQYDPNRTCNIALMRDLLNNKFYYTLALDGTKEGDIIKHKQQTNFNFNIGTTMLIKDIPLGIKISNIEIQPGKGSKLVRSAGCYAIIIKKEKNYALIKLNNNKLKKIALNSKAIIGQISNIEHYLDIIGKAGKNRGKNIRPHVRGTAMNPIDHPHGGGQGKTSGGRCSVTPWGHLTKGKKTRKNKIKKYEI